MEALTAAAWAREAPYVATTAGDLHWWMYQHTNKLDEVRIALWEDGEELVGWSWLWLPNALVVHVAPERRAGPLYGEMLDWFEAEAAVADQFDAHVLDTHTELRRTLEERSYALVGDESLEHMTLALDDLVQAPAPAGFELRPVRLPEELEQRVEAHRGAFAPSRVTPESYSNVVAAAPYRRDLDWVAVAADCRVAAFALVWLDARNGVAELEPVGTHPDFRRLGLARAVCAAALGAARAAGARTGLVYAVTGNPSVDLYRSLGFRSVARHVVLRRESDRRRER
jgi:ribosomal protein S18 acetylase RimI-like enzyme